MPKKTFNSLTFNFISRQERDVFRNFIESNGLNSEDEDVFSLFSKKEFGSIENASQMISIKIFAYFETALKNIIRYAIKYEEMTNKLKKIVDGRLKVAINFNSFKKLRTYLGGFYDVNMFPESVFSSFHVSMSDYFNNDLKNAYQDRNTAAHEYLVVPVRKQMMLSDAISIFLPLAAYISNISNLLNRMNKKNNSLMEFDINSENTTITRYVEKIKSINIVTYSK